MNKVFRHTKRKARSPWLAYGGLIFDYIALRFLLFGILLLRASIFVCKIRDKLLYGLLIMMGLVIVSLWK